MTVCHPPRSGANSPTAASWDRRRRPSPWARRRRTLLGRSRTHISGARPGGGAGGRDGPPPVGPDRASGDRAHEQQRGHHDADEQAVDDEGRADLDHHHRRVDDSEPDGRGDEAHEHMTVEGPGPAGPVDGARDAGDEADDDEAHPHADHEIAPAGRDRGVSEEDGGFEGGAGDDEQGGHGADDGVHDGFRFDVVGGWAVDEWTDGKTVNGGRTSDGRGRGGRGAAVGVSPFCCGTGPDPVGPVRLA